MSKNLKSFEEFQKVLEKKSDSWDEALVKGNQLIHEKSGKIREELIKRRQQLRNEETELKDNFHKTDFQLMHVLNRIQFQIKSIESQSNYTFGTDSDRKNKLLEQIYTDSHKDMIEVMNRHKNRFNTLDQILVQNARNITQIDAISQKSIDSLKKSEKTVKDIFNKLEANKKEIDNKFKELEELKKKELEEWDKNDENSFKEEKLVNDRQNEMNKSFDKMKPLFK